MSYYYLTIEQMLLLYDKLIIKGSKGVQNIGITESVLIHIQNDELYPTFEDKLVHLCHSIIKNHSFRDGNKRMAFIMSVAFLEYNNYPQELIDYFAEEIEEIIYHTAAGSIDKILLGKVIYSLLNEADYSESLKLKLIEAIENE